MSTMAVVVWLAAIAAGPQTSARDRATPPPTGTGIITGRVFEDDGANQPVRRATVMLSSGPLSVPQATATDDEGRFAFASLPDGNYTLAALKGGYVQTTYGARRPGRGQGVPLALVNGQRLADLTIRLLRGSVITGTVTEQNGRPAAFAGVQVTEVDTTGGARKPVLGAHRTTTDDRGEYRVFGLPPGEYLVMALPPSSAGTAGLRRVTEAEIQWAAAASSAAATPGFAQTPLATAPPAGAAVAYAPVYYPGTTEPALAATVTVGRGEERGGVNFSTALVPTATISGVVLDVDGRPAAGSQISLRVNGETESTDMVSALLGRGGARASANGEFTLHNVVPGRYTIKARGTPGGERAGAPSRGQAATSLLSGLFGSGTAGGATLWASQDLVVQGQDLENVSLQLQPGVTLSGHVVYDGASPPPDKSATRLALSEATSGLTETSLATAMIGSTAVQVAADGTFRVEGIAPNRYRLAPSGLSMFLPGAATPDTWVLESVSWNGRDIADTPFEVRAGQDISGVVATYTDRPTQLSGRILDKAGRPASTFPIVVFGTDRAAWILGSRRIQRASPSSDGSFTLSGLPPGDYFVTAVTDLEPAQLYDPAFLEQLVPAAVRLSLAPGEQKVQNLQLAGGG